MFYRKYINTFLLGAALSLSTTSSASLEDGQPYSVNVDQAGYLIDGEYKLLRGGTIQWFRLPEGAWRDRLKRFKAAGFNTVDMYIAWNQIEKTEGVFDFESQDIKQFLALCQELGLYVYFRPGPYITNEMDGGGVPGWLMDKTTKKSKNHDGLVNLRTDDPDYLYYVERYLDRLNQEIKPFLASNGGPIILYALENEYNWFEIFHEVDKLFWYNGGPERDLWTPLPTRNYFTALRDMTLADGIDVPLATCPGDGKASATGDVEGIIPMPNVYNGLGGELPEKVAYDMLVDMHNPNNHNGAYVNFPSGTTETDREAVRIKRMYMGGFDAAFAFNIAGYHQEGYMNSTVLNVNGGNIVDNLLDFSNFGNIITGYISPTVGYFHNVVDFNGAISPSAQLRDSFYEFKRDNLFFTSVENSFASATLPHRSGQVSQSDPRLAISNTALGAIENNDRIHYWHESPDGSVYINVVNQSGVVQTIQPNGITLDGLSFPRFSTASVAPKGYSGPGQFGEGDTTSAIVLLANHDAPGIGHIDYATAEILTMREFNGDNLMVIFGQENTTGEIQFSGLSQAASIDFYDNDFAINQNSNGTLNITMEFDDGYNEAVITMNGERTRIIATNPDNAGRLWFFNGAGYDVAIGGVDYIDEDQVYISPTGAHIDVDYNNDVDHIYTLTPAPVSIAGLVNTKAYNTQTQSSLFSAPSTQTVPTIANDLLHSGKVKTDTAEAGKHFDDSQWDSWTGNPRSAESNDIIKGTMWYRAELHLSGWNWLPFWEPTDLYVEHASDIIGIYVNGIYLTTLNPLGTELDSNSWNSKYQFPSLRPYLKKGKNVIAFKVEIWGHGSFMFGRGNVTATAAQIPSVGFDSEKGLFGEAKVGWRQLNNWSIHAGFNGQNQGYQYPSYNDSGWQSMTMPTQLSKGDITWYRTTFDASELPSMNDFHAPVVLNVKGKNAKGTIYVNGHLIGRWISDEDWLDRGFWGRADRDMWINTSPDHFPVDRSILNPAGQTNSVSIIFEDTSSDVESAGYISELNLQYSQENAGESDIKSRKTLTMQW